MAKSLWIMHHNPNYFTLTSDITVHDVWFWLYNVWLGNEQWGSGDNRDDNGCEHQVPLFAWLPAVWWPSTCVYSQCNLEWKPSSVSPSVIPFMCVCACVYMCIIFLYGRRTSLYRKTLPPIKVFRNWGTAWIHFSLTPTLQTFIC